VCWTDGFRPFVGAAGSSWIEARGSLRLRVEAPSSTASSTAMMVPPVYAGVMGDAELTVDLVLVPLGWAVSAPISHHD